MLSDLHCCRSPHSIVLSIAWIASLAILNVDVDAAEGDSERRPNIVVILADDLGYGDVGCYGATKVRTPNVDRLANQGCRFTDAHSPCSVCTPTRYNLLAGRYAWRTWARSTCVWSSDPLLIEPDRLTVASLLKRYGYATACVGKWHLGFGRPGMLGWDDVLGPDYNGKLKPGPLEVGFDYFFGIPHVGQFPHVYIRNHRVVGLKSGGAMRLIPDKRPAFHRSFLERPRNGGGPPRHTFEGTEDIRYKHEDLAIRLTKEAVAWIERQPLNRPFFLYFAHRNVHSPVRPNPRFRGTSDIGVYGDFIHELDWSVGEILDALERRGHADNTLVLFSSDNGAVDARYKPVDFVDYSGHRANGPWRGQKTEAYEGGHRVPLIVRWPGHVRLKTTSDQLVALTDTLATVAELMGVELPPGAGEDSFSFLHAILGRIPSRPVRNAIVNDSFRGQFAVRQGPWKLLLCQGGGGLGWEPDQRDPDLPPGQIYNLDDDPTESENLYRSRPEMVEHLTNLLEEYKTSGHSRPIHSPPTSARRKSQPEAGME
jgi:arylsulfatase A-like enzyme